jgi:SAM-dependent methyltransferase
MLRFRRLRARTPGIDDLIPPQRALPSYTRKGDFKKAGAGFLHAAVDAGLEPHHGLLDLGCGVGRLAVALSQYLDDRGSYVGMDTDHKAITICNEWIGSKLPQFTFVWADVFNTSYNPSAEAKAAQYRFPFDDDAFDFVFSNSLFTHLVPDDARNYFHEIGRVLKPGGRTVNTIFLLNEESLPLIESGESRQGVLHEFGDLARVKRPNRPEAWIALDEDFVRQAHNEAGLGIEEVRYGAWSGREASGPGFGKKDIIVAQK